MKEKKANCSLQVRKKRMFSLPAQNTKETVLSMSRDANTKYSLGITPHKKNLKLQMAP